MKSQLWYCGRCNMSGSVALEPHADVYSAIYKIEDNHGAVSPSCSADVTRIQVPRDEKVLRELIQKHISNN